MQPGPDQAKGNPTGFAMILSFIGNFQGGIPLKSKHVLEIDAMFHLICSALALVPLVPHSQNVATFCQMSSHLHGHPWGAFYRRRDGAVGSYSVWHEKLALGKGAASRASFDCFHQLGLTTSASVPCSVLVQRAAEFLVLLPPERVLIPSTRPRKP